jgi:glutamate---cysteine ligase / carboxylate-amine ligase
MCDAQTTADDSTALAGLMVACVAQAALDHDEGTAPPPAPARVIEENMWRAIRYGLSGRMIDIDRGEEYPARALPERLLAWTAPARAALAIEPALPREDGAERQRRGIAEGGTMEEVYAAELAETQRTYEAEGAIT